MASNNFYKNEASDLVWWVDDPQYKGRIEFSFDRKKIYNLFRDYPEKLNPRELEIFNRENPFWVDFFSGR